MHSWIEDKEPLVSIIIPEFTDDKYVVRCLNSIKRQTYKNIEVVFGMDVQEKYLDETVRSIKRREEDRWGNLNKAINVANGEYIFICNVSTVLSPNLLLKLVQSCKSSTLGGVRILNVLKGNIKQENIEDITIIGKLFNKNVINDNKILLKSKERYPEYTFLEEYLQYCTGTKYINDEYLYDNTDNFIINPSIKLAKDDIFKCLERVNLDTISAEATRRLILDLMDSIVNYNLEETIQVAIHMHEDYILLSEINYVVAERYLKNVYSQCIKNNDALLWKNLQKYVNSIKDEQFLKLIGGLWGISLAECNLIKKYCIADYLFYKDKITENEKDESRKIWDAIKHLEKNLNQKTDSKKVDYRNNKEKEVVYQKEQLRGVELGEYVITEYEGGRMGIGYIFRFLKAWLKYKLQGVK